MSRPAPFPAFSRALLERLWPILAGLSAALAYPPFDQAWIIWLAPAALWLGLRHTTSGQRAPGTCGYLWGVAFFGVTLWWVGHVTVLGAVGLILYLAIYPAAWSWWISRVLPVTVNHASSDIGGTFGQALGVAAIGASGWVVLEWARGFFIATGFGWDWLGVALWNQLPFLQLCRIGGVLLLSWLVAWASLVGVLALERMLASRTSEARRLLLTALLVVVIVFAYGMRTLLQESKQDRLILDSQQAAEDSQVREVRVALIQPNIPQLVWSEAMSIPEMVRVHEMWTAQALAQKPTWLLWPESPLSQDPFEDQPLERAVARILEGYAGWFLLGAVPNLDGTVFNSAIAMAGMGLIQEGSSISTDPQIYNKVERVLFGEYIPGANAVPWLRRFVPYAVDIHAGKGPVVFELTDARGRSVRAGAVICFEDTLPRHVRRYAALAPDVLVNFTNDGWFFDSPEAAHHLANAVPRCVELGIPMIRCTNSGISCIINRLGVIETKLSDEHGNSTAIGGILVADFKFRTAERESDGKPVLTPYARWGDWIAALSVVVAGGATLAAAWKRRRRKR